MVRFVDTDPRPMTPESQPEMFHVACPEPECSWEKRIARGIVTASLRGHYGYRHPERRLPDRRDAERVARPVS